MISSIADAVAFARSRGVVLPDAYYGSVFPRDRAMGFSIAGQIDIDAIQHVKELLDTALSEGQPFKQWQKSIKDAGLLEFYQPHRLENIFRTNLQLAYSAGRCRTIKNARTPRDYLMYSAVGGRQGDGRTRPSHAARHGTILHRDHEWWRTNTPSIDYQCRCTVIQLTEKQALARGGITESPPQFNDGFGYSVCHEGAEEGLKRSIFDMNSKCSTVNVAPIWCGNEDMQDALRDQSHRLNNYSESEYMARQVFPDYDAIKESTDVFSVSLASSVSSPFVVSLRDYHDDAYFEVDSANRQIKKGEPLAMSDDDILEIGQKISLLDQFIGSHASGNGEYYARAELPISEGLIKEMMTAYVAGDQIKLPTYLTVVSNPDELANFAGSVSIIYRGEAVQTPEHGYIIARDTSINVYSIERQGDNLVVVLSDDAPGSITELPNPSDAAIVSELNNSQLL